MRRRPLAAALAVLFSCVACAGDLVLRAPRERVSRGDTALASIPPLAVELPPVQGGGSSREPVGERVAGLGAAAAKIYLTEDPGAVVWRLVAEELRAAGHRVVESGGSARVETQLIAFTLRSVPSGLGWDVSADVRFSIRALRRAGGDEWTESVYTSERSQRTYARPGVRTTEGVLAECLDELAELVSRRDALPAALERFSRPPAERS